MQDHERAAPAGTLPTTASRHPQATSAQGSAGNRLLSWLLLLVFPTPGAAQAQTAQTVPANWALIPDGVNPGDSFRLLFVTSTSRNAQSSNIADYNSFVQGRANNGHTAIQSFSGEFRVVGCTSSVNAKTNTAPPAQACPSTG